MATSATWTCAAYPSRPTPDRPSPRRWNWSRGPTRLSSTCGTTAAAHRKGWLDPGCSDPLEEHPTHLNDIFHADTGETRQFWALPYVPGTRYVDRPVYVLTSSHTFSGGEDFCYTLQALGRAQVIGETTGGGAHPTRPFPISPAVHIAIPFARSINPVTGTNWQGTGVVPDVAVPEERAYDVAYGLALRHVLAMDDLPAADRGRGPRRTGRASRSSAGWPGRGQPRLTPSGHGGAVRSEAIACRHGTRQTWPDRPAGLQALPGDDDLRTAIRRGHRRRHPRPGRRGRHRLHRHFGCLSPGRGSHHRGVTEEILGRWLQGKRYRS